MQSEYNHLIDVEPGKGMWNLRGEMKMAPFLDIGTHMSFVKRSNGRFLVFDTINVNKAQKEEIDRLTQNGELIDCVIATHPFHTLFFKPFHMHYPQPHIKWYGCPRHLLVVTGVPWQKLPVEEVLTSFEGDGVYLSIPEGPEWENPVDHFNCVFVFHKPSRSLHCDDTVMYFDDQAPCILCCVIKRNSMMLHSSTFNKGEGLNTPLRPMAARQFVEWMERVVFKWDFDNLLAAHCQNKLGGAKQQLMDLFEHLKPKLLKISSDFDFAAAHQQQLSPIIPK
jgi:hypothetical protein